MVDERSNTQIRDQGGLPVMSAIQNLSALVSRANLAARLGQHYSGSRDIYQALGYPTSITYDDYVTQYTRQDITKAIINRPVEATWRGKFTIQESDDADETPLEKRWRELDAKLGLKDKFVRLDKLSSLGKYGVLFLGFDGTVTEGDLAREVVRATDLLYVKPLGEGNAQIAEWERDTTNPRYGLPKIYNLTIVGPNKSVRDIRVHHSRVIHVPGELLESECEGVPVLEAVFNRLKDLEKIVGASAEMFWRGGRPGYHGKVEKDAQLTEDAEEELMNQLNEYEHNLRRFLLTQGIDVQSLATQVVDPAQAVEVQIQMISAVTGIPKRILTGSERGELASTQDKNNWLDMIQARREEFAEIQIVRPFVDRLIEVGVLPKPQEEYSVWWEDLYAQSEEDKAAIGKARSEILKNYASVPAASDHMPLEAFYKILMYLDDEEIELIMEQREQAIMEEEKEAMKLETELLQEEQHQQMQQTTFTGSEGGQQVPPVQ